MLLENIGGHKLILEPFLHYEESRIYNPITDRICYSNDTLYNSILICRDLGINKLNNETFNKLINDKWIIVDNHLLLSRHYLKVVTIEGNSHCNQRCYFCPVAESPKPIHTMPLNQYEHIVRQLSDYKNSVEAVFMINYNEPSVDKFFVERIEILMRHNLPVCINTNATGLNPKNIDKIRALGQLRFLSINLSTIDKTQYREDRKWNNLELVMNNLNYLKNIPIAKEMVIAVLGEEDEKHIRNFESISEAFRNTYFEVKRYPIMDRAGILNVGNKIDKPINRLYGCNNLGSRPLQHLHINSYGECVLCCEDYHEDYKIGNLNSQTIKDVLAGEKAQRLRGIIYGLSEAPKDFICRKCIYALSCKY